jgi:microsomal epoxide hydrolase
VHLPRAKSLLIILLVFASTAPAQSAAKSAFFTTTDGVRLHYLDAGGGPAAIVFIPGWTMPGWIWEKQIAHFAAKYRVIAVDPRSQGESDKATDGNYPERRARDYKELLDHLNLTAPVLVGWSMGVHELLTYVDVFGPGSVSGLVLVDGFIWEKPDPQMARGVGQMSQGLQLDRHKFAAGFVRSMYHKPQGEDYFRRVTEASLATPTNTAAVLIYNLAQREDWTPALAKLAEAKTPVLATYTGQEKTSIELTRSKLPAATVTLFEDAGHALFVDDADRFNASLQTFLDSIPKK